MTKLLDMIMKEAAYEREAAMRWTMLSKRLAQLSNERFRTADKLFCAADILNKKAACTWRPVRRKLVVK